MKSVASAAKMRLAHWDHRKNSDAVRVAAPYIEARVHASDCPNELDNAIGEKRGQTAGL